MICTMSNPNPLERTSNRSCTNEATVIVRETRTSPRKVTPARSAASP
jgi:hypothetical protein